MGIETDCEIADVCKRINVAIEASPYRDFSLREIATKFQCSHTTVRRWLSGKAIPSFSAALIVCKVLNVSFEWLMTGQGIMTALPLTLDEYALIEIFRHLSGEQQREYLSFGYYQIAKTQSEGTLFPDSQTRLDLISRDQK